MKNTHVRGHTCPGFETHLDTSAYSCIPRIDADGTIKGCDGTNDFPILYCPFCGEKLPEPVIVAEAEEDDCR